MAKKRNLNKGFGGRKQQPKQHTLAVVLHFILSPVVVAPVNLLLASLCSVLAAMIITRYGDTKYMTSLSPRDLLPAFLPMLGGLVLKIHSKKSFKELWGSFVTTYGKRWTLALIILTSVLALFLYTISQHAFWMKRPSADLKNHETLVLLTKFKQVSGNPLSPNEEWGYTCEKLKDIIGKEINLSCQIVPQEIHSDAEAHTFSDVYKATLVIWGSVRAAVVETHYRMDIRWGGGDFFAQKSLVFGTLDQLSLFVSRDGGDLEYVLNFLAGHLMVGLENPTDFSRSLPYLNKALELVPKDRAKDMGELDLLAQRGWLAVRLGKADEGLVYLNQAIQLYPASSQGYVARGLSYGFLGKYDLALNDLSKAIEIGAPYLSDAYQYRGRVYSLMGKHELALVDLNHAVEIGANIPAYIARAFEYTNMAEYGKALSDLNFAISLNPDEPSIYAHRGLVYAQQQQWDLALIDFDKAIEIDNNLSEVYANRGETLLEMGETEQAIKDLDKALRLDPTDSSGGLTYYNRALAYVILGKPDLAIVDFTSSIELGQSEVIIQDAYYDRATVYSSMGRYQKALDSLQPYLAKEKNPSAKIVVLVGSLKRKLANVP